MNTLRKIIYRTFKILFHGVWSYEQSPALTDEQWRQIRSFWVQAARQWGTR